jgi:BirA family biotin operon repressor/biotin-[acetyl-CoA-carboxylase] ligase
MSGDPPPLSSESLALLAGAAGIAAGIGAQIAAEIDWEAVAVTASTNDDLAARARVRAPRRPLVRAADVQTAGRGRQGRPWHAAAGEALLFSIAVPWSGAPAEAAAVTLAFGVAVARCLEQSGVPVALKWPNDVLLGGRKLAGILTEVVADGAGALTLVVGLGLNLRVDAARRRLIGQPVAELAECLGHELPAARESWLVRLALALVRAAGEYRQRGFAGCRAQYERLSAFLGRPVEVRSTGQVQIQGIMRGVDEQGRLLLECEGRILTIMSGDMSLREHQ